MLRVCVGAMLVSACGFTNEVPGEEEIAGDAGVDPNNPNPNPTPLVKCNAADKTGMVLCVDFEDAPGFADFFAADTTAVNISSMDRMTTEKAAQFAPSSLYTIDNAAKFNVPQVTIEMWTKPAADPGGMNEQGLFHYYLNYAMLYEGGSRIECLVGANTYSTHRIESKATLSTDQWHHVACTYSGSELRVYVDGKLEGCKAVTTSTANYGVHGGAIGATIPTGGTQPMYVNRFVGQLDNVRVYNRKLDADDICKIATGGTDCSGSCGDS